MCVTSRKSYSDTTVKYCMPATNILIAVVVVDRNVVYLRIDGKQCSGRTVIDRR